MIGQLQIVYRLLLAALLGGIVGLERESHRHPAGLRTHILVCVGSCLVMLVGVYGFPDGNRDPARLAAQVVSGIGFLGAGTIMRDGATVKGLTTAATLWVVAAIGLAVGSGYIVAALFSTVLIIGTLIALSSIESRIMSNSHTISVTVDDRPGMLGAVAGCLGNRGLEIMDIHLSRANDDVVGSTVITFRVNSVPHSLRSVVLDDLRRIDGVRASDIG